MRLCSQIGRPIDRPLIASAQLITQRGVTLADVQPAVESVIEHELATIGDFTLKHGNPLGSIYPGDRSRHLRA